MIRYNPIIRYHSIIRYIPIIWYIPIIRYNSKRAQILQCQLAACALAVWQCAVNLQCVHCEVGWHHAWAHCACAVCLQCGSILASVAPCQCGGTWVTRPVLSCHNNWLLTNHLKQTSMIITIILLMLKMTKRLVHLMLQLKIFAKIIPYFQIFLLPAGISQTFFGSVPL